MGGFSGGLCRDRVGPAMGIEIPASTLEKNLNLQFLRAKSLKFAPVTQNFLRRKLFEFF